MTALVLINMIFLLVDMMVTEPPCTIYGNASDIQQCLVEWDADPFISGWNQGFQIMELSFLSTFAIDILIRFYAYGYSYFFDVLNCVDAIIVFSLFLLQVFILTFLVDGASSFSFLRIVRLVRLVRLFVVMNKVQKAQRAYKKAKYLKLGSPVERVMELLSEMKNRIEEADDVADIAWIMHLISSDKLYTIDIRAAGGGNLSSEMTAWLEDNLGMKKDIDHEAEDTGTTSVGAPGGSRPARA